MFRTHGKPSCRCVQGEKRSSLYLSVKLGRNHGRNTIPAAVEAVVRAAMWVFRETSRLVDEISASNHDRFPTKKAEERTARGKGAQRRCNAALLCRAARLTWMALIKHGFV
jgi:hypothetical protein